MHVLPHLPQLRHLDLSFKSLHMCAVRGLSDDPSYKTRVDHDSHFSVQLTTAVSHLKQLRCLKASRALLEMTHTSSPFAAALPESLKELVLAHAPVCAPMFGADIARLTALETLHLSFDIPGVPQQAIEHLSSLQRLRELCIANPGQTLDLEAEATEHLLTVLPAGTIERLFIPSCEFSVEACRPLSALSALSSLMIGSIEDTLTDDIALSLARCLPKLTALQRLSLGFWGTYTSAAAKSALRAGALHNIAHVDYGMCVDLQL